MPFPKYQVTDATYYIIRHTEKRRTQKIIKKHSNGIHESTLCTIGTSVILRLAPSTLCLLCLHLATTDKCM